MTATAVATVEEEAQAELEARGYSVMRDGGGWTAERRGPRGDVVDRVYGPGVVDVWLQVRDRWADSGEVTWDRWERARLREMCRVQPTFRVEVVRSLLDEVDRLRALTGEA